MTEVDYGGGGHRTRLREQEIDCCVYGVPPPPYIKGGERGRLPGGARHALQKKDTSVTFWAERKKIVILMTLL